MVHRVECQLHPIRHSHFVEDAREVVLHRLSAEPESLRDLTIAGAFDNGPDHFELSGREDGRMAASSTRAGPHERLDQIGNALTIQPVLAGSDALDAFD